MTGWHWLLLGLGVTLVVYAALLVGMVLVGRRRDARAVASFLPDCLFLLRALLRDPRVPTRRKLLVVALVLRSMLRSGGPELLREHWRGPQRGLDVLLRLT